MIFGCDLLFCLWFLYHLHLLGFRFFCLGFFYFILFSLKLYIKLYVQLKVSVYMKKAINLSILQNYFNNK